MANQAGKVLSGGSVTAVVAQAGRRAVSGVAVGFALAAAFGATFSQETANWMTTKLIDRRYLHLPFMSPPRGAYWSFASEEPALKRDRFTQL